jgi:hypothetical protein
MRKPPRVNGDTAWDFIVGDWERPVKKFRTELIPIGETPPGLLA